MLVTVILNGGGAYSCNTTQSGQSTGNIGNWEIDDKGGMVVTSVTTGTTETLAFNLKDKILTIDFPEVGPVHFIQLK